MSSTDKSEAYFEALIKSYDALALAIEKVSERGGDISKQFRSDLAARQREAIDLARKVAAEPANVAVAYSAIMEATVSAQSQALEFSQAAYKQTAAADSEAREAVEVLLSASRTAAEAALELSRDWQSSNPWADMFRKNMEAFTAATPPAGASASA